MSWLKEFLTYFWQNWEFCKNYFCTKNWCKSQLRCPTEAYNSSLESLICPFFGKSSKNVQILSLKVVMVKSVCDIFFASPFTIHGSDHQFWSKPFETALWTLFQTLLDYWLNLFFIVELRIWNNNIEGALQKLLLVLLSMFFIFFFRSAVLSLASSSPKFSKEIYQFWFHLKMQKDLNWLKMNL